jgi:hypothetical protein
MFLHTFLLLCCCFWLIHSGERGWVVAESKTVSSSVIGTRSRLNDNAATYLLGNNNCLFLLDILTWFKQNIYFAPLNFWLEIYLSCFAVNSSVLFCACKCGLDQFSCAANTRFRLTTPPPQKKQGRRTIMEEIAIIPFYLQYVMS